MSETRASGYQKVKSIAFYLPQYHPIPENDAWWGAGFTEWSYVVRAKPLFPSHYQPHFPADLGFYDLRLPEVRAAQAELAERHGLYGFCHYHYWFNGRRILERPFQEVLCSGEPRFPFCLCWANENWTRAWDGGEREVLLAQTYSPGDDLNHIRALLPALGDPRYIHVDGRPLLLVYRLSCLPEPRSTAEIWRNEVVRAGLPEPLLVMVESLGNERMDPRSLGFDATVEFAPDWLNTGSQTFGARRRLNRYLRRFRLANDAYLNNRFFDYRVLRDTMLAKPLTPYRRFPGVTPGWDNTARRQKGNAAVWHGSTPMLYQEWLSTVVRRETAENQGDSVVFVNAWNEWAEGCHLEPCARWGHAYLTATKRALSTSQRGRDRGA